ncbi:MAG: IS110 family transposase [Spirochaetes bacterium]|nr:IS110 family transposase [Spirochaetota bacterium]
MSLHLLRTIPGIGQVLALVILYEVHDIHRFPKVGNFISYCRNVHLKWEFS